MPPKLKRRTINRVWVYLPEGGWPGKPRKRHRLKATIEYTRKKKPARNPLPEHYR